MKNISDEKSGVSSSVGVRGIVRKSKVQDATQFALESFSFSKLDAPGRPKGKEDQEHIILSLQAKLEQKNKEIESLKKSHSQEIERSCQENFQKGKLDGTAQGEEKASLKFSLELKALSERVESVFSELQLQRKDLFLGYEEYALELVLVCVKKVFAEYAEQHREAIYPILRQCIQQLEEKTPARIKVNPVDYPLLSENIEFWNSVGVKLSGVQIVSDTNLPKLSCVVEAVGETVVSSWPEIVSKMELALARVLAYRIEEELKDE